MANKNINDLTGIQLSEFTSDDYVLYWDTATSTTKKCSVAHFASNAQLVADGLYNQYFMGSFASAGTMPASGEVDQWLIRTDVDTLWVWDAETTSWTETGASGGGSTTDVAYTFTYGASSGTGYGYVNAESRLGNNFWNNTPDGMLQTTNGYATNYNRVKFATLKNPGDQVFLDGIPENTAYLYRWAVVGLTPGADPAVIFTDANKDIGSGTSYYGTPSNSGNGFTGIELHNCFVRPYFGTTSYAGNMRRVNGTGNVSPAEAGDVSIGYRMAADYHIEFLIDGNVVGKTVIVPTEGVDLYILAPVGRRFPQPTGALADVPDTPADAPISATPTNYWISNVSTHGTSLAAGGGYFVYADDTAVDVSDIQLTAEEAAISVASRVFVDYTGKTLEERASLTDPIVRVDGKVLDDVTRLVRGYFHSQDLTLPEISDKMTLYGEALAAAAAGSVELTLALMQSLTIPTASGGTYEDFDPWHVTYSPTGTCDTRASFYPGTEMRDQYGITGARFYAPSPGSSLGQMEFYFATSADSTAWRSQDRTVQFNVPSSVEGFEGIFTVTAADEAYASGSQVTYSNPDTWGAAEVGALAGYTVSNFGSTDIELALGAPVAQSPADALGETEVVAKVIADLSLHLAKFPR